MEVLKMDESTNMQSNEAVENVAVESSDEVIRTTDEENREKEQRIMECAKILNETDNKNEEVGDLASEIKEESTPALTRRPVRCGWNWGPFAFGWIYGLFNKSWICLITLIPAAVSWLINKPFPSWITFILFIVCGVIGEEQSYKNNLSNPGFDVRKWKKNQRGWDLAGAIVTALMVVIAVFWIGVMFGARVALTRVIFF